MAMQTNISKKDKITIAVVLFAGIVFVSIWYLIRPNITSIMTISDKIEEAELTQTQYRNKLINLTSGEAIYDKTVSDFKDSTSYLYPTMDSSEIDRIVTSYVLKSGLFAENLTISMPSGAVDEKPYMYSSLADDNNDRRSISIDSSVTTSDESSSVTTSDESDESSTTTTVKTTTVDSLLTPYDNARNNCRSTQSSGVQRVGITIVVTGTQKACQAMIDDLCTKPALRITGFEWDDVDVTEKVNPETGEVELVNAGTVRLRISVNLYMADISDYEVAVSEG